LGAGAAASIIPASHSMSCGVHMTEARDDQRPLMSTVAQTERSAEGNIQKKDDLFVWAFVRA
jgi:hypothetical protein